MRALRPYALALLTLVFASAIVIPPIVYANATSVETGGTQYLPALVCTNNTSGATALAIQTNTRFYMDGVGGSRYWSFDGSNVNLLGANGININGGWIAQGVIVGNGPGAISTNGNHSLDLASSNPDGASAIGVKIRSAAFTTSGAKIASFQNSTTEKAYIDKDGALTISGVAADANAINLTNDNFIAWNSTNTLKYRPAASRFEFSGNIKAGDVGSGTNTFTGTSALSNTYSTPIADSAGSVAHILNTTVQQTNAGAKLLSVRNLGSEKLYVDYLGAVVTSSNNGYTSTNATGQGMKFSGTNTSITAGSAGSTVFMSDQSTNFVDANTTRILTDTTQGIRMTPKAMPTCGASIEWAMLPDSASGVATGKRSKMCMCTSSGASVYVWQNMVTGTLGTTTTCGTE